MSGQDTQVQYIDKELLARIAAGDGDAFHEFYRHFAPRLRAYVLKSTRSDSATEEILQASFIRIWLSRDKLPDIDNVPAWVYTVTARVCLQHFRRTKREKERMDRLQVVAPAETITTPMELMYLEEIRSVIQRALVQMPDSRRTIYRLSREQGKKPAEIAQLQGMPVGTVKNQLSAAMREIRESLALAGYGQFAWLLVCFPFFK
ncbi:MAG: sigma-70 family RNA polymerase sigma factor [Candidatus Pseudobacter hemicellulosilyticus]|uniref:Sigma-70 family RNA polymerase sigma factor n=1 Tax=Candidatus Pseudobacter hemicellulosilyticus TaxID=3121375 RepID=A0AAJ6BFG9_9BACT|nr:MAG: sigma-70 family RNA polymerase sigma factor [Pseudobacter sp.]